MEILVFFIFSESQSQAFIHMVIMTGSTVCGAKVQVLSYASGSWPKYFTTALVASMVAMPLFV